MNMQIRSARSDETKSVIASIQERVRSLASIHKDLYQSQNEGRVDAGNLVSGIIDNTFDLGVSSEYDIDLDARIDAVLLYPDQAVPLSLLVAEAATNIMKYVRDRGQRRREHLPVGCDIQGRRFRAGAA